MEMIPPRFARAGRSNPNSQIMAQDEASDQREEFDRYQTPAWVTNVLVPQIPHITERREAPDTVVDRAGLLDQAGTTMARSQIELLGFVSASIKFAAKAQRCLAVCKRCCLRSWVRQDIDRTLVGAP